MQNLNRVSAILAKMLKLPFNEKQNNPHSQNCISLEFNQSKNPKRYQQEQFKRTSHAKKQNKYFTEENIIFWNTVSARRH